MRELTLREMDAVGGGYEGDFATETITVTAKKEVQWSNFSDFRYEYYLTNNSPEGKESGGGGVATAATTEVNTVQTAPNANFSINFIGPVVYGTLNVNSGTTTTTTTRTNTTYSK